MLAHRTFAHDTRRTALPYGLAPGTRRGGFMARSRRPNPFCISLHAAPHRLVRSFQTRRLRHLRAERGTRPATFQNLAHRPARSNLPLCLRRLALALAHGILRRDRNRSTGLSGQCRRLGERRHEERRRRCGVDARGDDRRQPAPYTPTRGRRMHPSGGRAGNCATGS